MWIPWGAVLSLALSCAWSAGVEFNRDVRPILSDKCFLCHGPDAAAKNVPRRLDIESDAKAARAGKRAVVPADPKASELIRRITASIPAVRMPPAYSGLHLTPAEISTLRRWI
ncbi:MAG: c-type cytochrome domain-containing protein, partial [Bryobacteraceae bacterium]